MVVCSRVSAGVLRCRHVFQKVLSSTEGHATGVRGGGLFAAGCAQQEVCVRPAVILHGLTSGLISWGHAQQGFKLHGWTQAGWLCKTQWLWWGGGVGGGAVVVGVVGGVHALRSVQARGSMQRSCISCVCCRTVAWFGTRRVASQHSGDVCIDVSTAASLISSTSCRCCARVDASRRGYYPSSVV
jgi:hypothetical protein